MGAAEDRRRTRIVDRRFQLGLAVRLLLVLTILFAAGLLLAFAPSYYVLATTNDLKSVEPAAAEFLVLHKRLLPAALFSLAGIFLYAIFFSRRIAGPLYRINAMLRALIEDRDPPAVKFRDDDYFQPTAVLLEELSEKMRASRRHPDAPPRRQPLARQGVMNRIRRTSLRAAGLMCHLGLCPAPSIRTLLRPAHANYRTGRRGFTLLEITIVLLLIGILAAIAISTYRMMINKARMSQAKTVLGHLTKTEATYFSNNDRYTDNTVLLDIDPVKYNYYEISVVLDNDAKNYTGTATGVGIMAGDSWTITKDGQPIQADNSVFR